MYASWLWSRGWLPGSIGDDRDCFSSEGETRKLRFAYHLGIAIDNPDFRDFVVDKIIETAFQDGDEHLPDDATAFVLKMDSTGQWPLVTLFRDFWELVGGHEWILDADEEASLQRLGVRMTGGSESVRPWKVSTCHYHEHRNGWCYALR